jgi:replication factor C subunit 3/5
MALPWVEKYRPEKLSDVLSHKEIISTIGQLMARGEMPHLLLYGPPGTGKTSTILALSKAINGPSQRRAVLELNASDERGINVVRQQIKDFVSNQQLFGSGIKLVVLDEADALTADAQMALRRTMEQASKVARFCIIANYVHKIIPAIQSRCTRFRFAPLPTDVVIKRVEEIAADEHMTVDKDGIELLVDVCAGDMRKVVNLLQACHMGYGKVDPAAVCSCAGCPLPKEIELLAKSLSNDPFVVAAKHVQVLVTDHGIALADLVKHLYKYVVKHAKSFKSLPHTLLALATLESHLAIGASETIQLPALVAAFKT